MKRIGNIYPQIIDKNNLLLAIKKASKGKKKRRNVDNVNKHLFENVDYLYKILKEDTFIPTQGDKMLIHDGVRKKERIIYKPRFFPDQCVHWALMLQISDIIRKTLIEQTCASIPGKRCTLYEKTHRKNSCEG